eukprot:TCONS_00052246-protein
MNTLNIIGVVILVSVSIGTVYFYMFNSRDSYDVSYSPDSGGSEDHILEKARKMIIQSIRGSNITSQPVIANKRNDLLYNKQNTPSLQKKSIRDRLGMIAYIPHSLQHAHQFLVLLHGSWKYIVDHQKELFPNNNNLDSLNDLDLLAFCHPSICKELAHVCTVISNLQEITATTVQRCWAVIQPFEIDIPYGPLNSFIMFNRTDIGELKTRYKYILRTDNDVFVTPAMFKLKPKVFLHGHGGYSDPFNMARLKQVAARLHMTHRGRHAIGSTWCGETAQFLKLAKRTLEVTRYVWLNEFDPNAKGLETIPFDKNREGEWIRWWRPVSLLYGGEITLNHMITDISEKNQGKFDSSSCDTVSVWTTPHIHCWHNDCEFQKFKFSKYLNIAIYGRASETLPGTIVHRIVENIYSQDVSKMNLQQYSQYIAWNSVSKYLRKRFV